MPMYDYECQKDGSFEAYQTISTREKSICPKCKTECPLKEVQGVNAFMAKTDYIPPPPAKRKFGDDHKTNYHFRKTWI